MVEDFKHVRYEDDSIIRNAEVSQLQGCLRHCRQPWGWRRNKPQLIENLLSSSSSVSIFSNSELRFSIKLLILFNDFH